MQDEEREKAALQSSKVHLGDDDVETAVEAEREEERLCPYWPGATTSSSSGTLEVVPACPLVA